MRKFIFITEKSYQLFVWKIIKLFTLYFIKIYTACHRVFHGNILNSLINAFAASPVAARGWVSRGLCPG
jgi:hypothetical protein